MKKPKITSWGDVSKLDATWECPECEAPYVFDCGNVVYRDIIYFTCDYCEYEEIFQLKLKLKRVEEEEVEEEMAVSHGC